MADKNILYYGNNLEVLTRHLKDDSVDLVYLDPPFNSNQDYNAFFIEQDGTRSAAQAQAFEDTWDWNADTEKLYLEMVEHGPGEVSRVLQGFRTFLNENKMMAYLANMAPRLVELRRVMKPTASIYLHCDPTASHYLKMLMDAVFGPGNFRNEIIWHYYNKFQRGDIPMFANGHDVIFFYTRERGDTHKFESIYEERDQPTQQLMREWDPATKRIVNTKDKDGHVMYRTVTHRKVDDVWRIPYIVPASKEGLGYPTQKPEALLERIITASSKPGDLVLDPFCGCGTAVAVSQRLGRRWIGIDITSLATLLIKNRLRDAFGKKVENDYKIVGEPTKLPEAEHLAKTDPYQFQWWALGLVNARPVEEKKGKDRGVDGRLYFHDDVEHKETKQIIFSVKAGGTGPNHVRDLRGVVEREKSAMGVLLLMEPPTKEMKTEAAKAGHYQGPMGTKHPRLQILTIEQLLDGKTIDMPPWHDARTFRKAPKAKIKGMKQMAIFDETGQQLVVDDEDDEES